MRRSVIPVLTVAVALASCATAPSGSLPGGTTVQPLNCVLMAEVARTQYEFSLDRPMPVNRDGYVPRCDWASLGVEIEVLTFRDIEPLSPLVTFGRPWGLGGQRQVRINFWNGIHTWTRTCRLERTAGEWRLVEECPVTGFY